MMRMLQKLIQLSLQITFVNGMEYLKQLTEMDLLPKNIFHVARHKTYHTSSCPGCTVPETQFTRIGLILAAQCYRVEHCPVARDGWVVNVSKLMTLLIYCR
jgi:hypothetical protein